MMLKLLVSLSPFFTSISYSDGFIKLFSCLHVLSLVSLNKDIKKNAKKDKKKAAKIAGKITAVEKEFGEDADIPSKPRGARIVSAMEVDEAYSFEEFYPTSKAAAIDEEEL